MGVSTYKGSYSIFFGLRREVKKTFFFYRFLAAW